MAWRSDQIRVNGVAPWILENHLKLELFSWNHCVRNVTCYCVPLRTAALQLKAQRPIACVVYCKTMKYYTNWIQSCIALLLITLLKKVEKYRSWEAFFWKMYVFLVSRREAKSALETKIFNCTFYNIKVFMPFTNKWLDRQDKCRNSDKFSSCGSSVVSCLCRRESSLHLLLPN